ncbi:hypothetical protein [Methanoculleus sp.]|uniref:hypothetical protein n=1 Tax=Methanoculleus sp. TaxID=90427 RepID=UPI0025F49308|nr:hypothetical protein [Methanoculleus sp.]
MTDAKTTRELAYETNRDVKWICRTRRAAGCDGPKDRSLRKREAFSGPEQEHRKVRLEEFEHRLRALEGWRAEKAGEERRLSTVSAGAGGVVGGVVVLVKVLGGG